MSQTHTSVILEQLCEESIDYRRLRTQRWRVYFNCRDHFPFLAAVDNGTIASQIRVQWVRLDRVESMTGRTDMGPKPAAPGGREAEIEDSLRNQRWGKKNEPTWWMEFEAIAVFENGGVIFHGQ